MKRIAVFLCMGLGLAALCAPVVTSLSIRVVYNPSDSVPRGWYSVGPAGALHADSIVLARLPAEVSALAAQRGYLPAGIPLLKRIGAVAPQRVCVDGMAVRIDGVQIAVARSADGLGRPLPIWQQCRSLSDGELFLLSATNPASFDSRYFGPIAAAAVIGSAQPLWTWGTP
jgi:conjugative transfer signal peptidase TraF